jgi:hypothetical protein
MAARMYFVKAHLEKKPIPLTTNNCWMTTFRGERCPFKQQHDSHFCTRHDERIVWCRAKSKTFKRECRLPPEPFSDYCSFHKDQEGKSRRLRLVK